MPKATNIARKRIMTDLQDINKNMLNDKGIYVHADEENMMIAYVLIIGPMDSPYEGDFTFSSSSSHTITHLTPLRQTL